MFIHKIRLNISPIHTSVFELRIFNKERYFCYLKLTFLKRGMFWIHRSGLRPYPRLFQILNLSVIYFYATTLCSSFSPWYLEKLHLFPSRTYITFRMPSTTSFISLNHPFPPRRWSLGYSWLRIYASFPSSISILNRWTFHTARNYFIVIIL